MEDIIFILLAFVWLIYSLYKGKSKKKQQEKPMPQTGDQPVREKKEKDFETIFREILGDEEVATESEAEVESIDKSTQTPQMQQEDEKPEEFQKHSGLSGVSDDFEFSAEGKIETIEDQVEKQEKQKDKHLEVIDLWDEQEDIESFDIDPRKAIIYSEIIKNKY